MTIVLSTNSHFFESQNTSCLWMKHQLELPRLLSLFQNFCCKVMLSNSHTKLYSVNSECRNIQRGQPFNLEEGAAGRRGRRAGEQDPDFKRLSGGTEVVNEIDIAFLWNLMDKLISRGAIEDKIWSVNMFFCNLIDIFNLHISKKNNN